MSQIVSQITSQNVPWEEVKDCIPAGFDLSRQGTFATKQDPELIAGPCWISAFTQSYDGDAWGVVIRFIDFDSVERELAVPIFRLTESGGSLASELSSRGLHVIHNKTRQLLQYLSSFLPTKRIKSVSKLGWLDDAETQQPGFVTAKKIIGLIDPGEIIFQPEARSITINSMHAKGALLSWQELVAKKCSGQPLLIFSMCVGMTGPLQKLVGGDCGGFHLYGMSSKGKTTALQCAASIWGCGADPSTNEHSYINRWNSTANAFEGTAAAHNDCLLCLDEMGTCDTQDFGNAIYNLMGGRGKSRLTKNASIQQSRSWRLIVLSTGEISVKQKIEEGFRGKAMTGQLVRMIDIPIHQGVVSHIDDPQGLINSLKDNCSNYYGTAGPAFIEALVQCESDLRGIKAYVQSLLTEIEPQVSPRKNLETFQQRVMTRFATVATAGVLACRFGILPFDENEIISAVRFVASAWLGDESNLPERVLGMLVLREFIVKNESRMRLVSDNDRIVKDLVGYWKYTNNGHKLFLLTPSGFDEAMHGFDGRSVLQELRIKKLLVCHEPSKFITKHTINGKRQGCYAIKDSILEFEGSQAPD